MTSSTASACSAGLWDPAIESLGLTVDTGLGPVDLVAVARRRSGRKVALTAAERTYLNTTPDLDPLLAGVLGLARDLAPATRKAA